MPCGGGGLEPLNPTLLGSPAAFGPTCRLLTGVGSVDGDPICQAPGGSVPGGWERNGLFSTSSSQLGSLELSRKPFSLNDFKTLKINASFLTHSN